MSATIEDFKEALSNLSNGERPCLSIPYSDLRGDCLSKAEARNNNCKIVEWRCTGAHDNNILFVNIKKKKQSLVDFEKALQVHRENINDDKDEEEIAFFNILIKGTEDQIKEAKDRIEKFEREVEERREKLRMRVEFGRACLASQQAMRDVFQEAISRAEREEEEEIKLCAKELIARWKDSILEHQNSFEETIGAIKNCQEKIDQQQPR